MRQKGNIMIILIASVLEKCKNNKLIARSCEEFFESVIGPGLMSLL
jgi:hypothetical protein